MFNLIYGTNKPHAAPCRMRLADQSRARLLLRSLLLVSIFLAIPYTAKAVPTTDTDNAVQYLIGYVANSDMVFIRNADRYTGPEAAEHMERKYQHFRKKISSPEDFIKLCATRSLMTGKPYSVITPQDQEKMTGEWLLEVLQEYRTSSQRSF